jgi:hypothetical protein
MTYSGDPYRILGLGPGASLDDVKRAYRRLAKQYHPDAAGPDAVTRFLAIQGAYEALAGPSRRGRPGTRPSPRGTVRPSEADPDRARATREAYRSTRGAWGRSWTGGRADDPWSWGSRGERRSTSDGRTATRNGSASRDGSGATGSAGHAAGGGATGAGSGGGATGAGSGGGATGAGSGGGATDAGPSGGATGAGVGSGADARRAGHAGRGGARRPSTRRKATLRSTSYDDAAREPRHPEWQGSSWYGTSSGTYWTINPREYADPRKHGPEYQARARRAAASAPPAAGADPAAGAWAGQEGDPEAQPTATGSPFFHHAGGAGDRVWSDAGPDPVTGAARWSAEEGSPRPVPASTIGLVAALAVAIPALMIVLGSLMSGRLWLTSVALVAPLAAGLVVGSAVVAVRRMRGDPG